MIPPPPPESSETPPPPPRSESPRVIPPPIPEQMNVEEIEDHFHTSSSSSPSSIFSIPLDEVEDAQLISRRIGAVLREGTATPSESQATQGSAANQLKGKEEGLKQGEDPAHGDGGKDGQEGRGGDGGSPENPDVNSEPNDSSGEEESGEDSQMLMESLNERLESGRVLPIAVSSSMRPGEESNAFLATLRKKLLTQLVERVVLVEEVGGMRAISYLQLLMFLTSQLECCSEDGKVLTSVLLALLHRLGLDQEDMLTQHTVDDMVERSKRREVLLLYLRFFNILMSRRKVKGEDGKVSGWGMCVCTCKDVHTYVCVRTCMYMHAALLGSAGMMNSTVCIRFVMMTSIYTQISELYLIGFDHLVTMSSSVYLSLQFILLPSLSSYPSLPSLSLLLPLPSPLTPHTGVLHLPDAVVPHHQNSPQQLPHHVLL